MNIDDAVMEMRDGAVLARLAWAPGRSVAIAMPDGLTYFAALIVYAWPADESPFVDEVGSSIGLIEDDIAADDWNVID